MAPLLLLLDLLGTVGSSAMAPAACGGLGDANDWLTEGCHVPSTFAQTALPDGSTQFALSNGIVSRTLIANRSTGLLTTVSIMTMADKAEKLTPAHPAPETMFSVNSVNVLAGGMAASDASDTRPRAKFVAARSSTGDVRAGGFHWVPGSRGSNPNTAWPPKGVHAEFDHALPCASINAGGGSDRFLLVTTVLELYDQTASFGRRVRLSHNCSAPLFVFNMSVSALNVARDRDITPATDAAVSHGSMISDGPHTAYHANSFLPIDPALPAGAFGPGLSQWTAEEPPFESYFVAETVFDVPYQRVQDAPSRGMQRYGLIGARMTRTLSPQVEQSPVKVSGYCTGGVRVPPPDQQAGSVGAWCYDAEGTAATKALLAQCIDAGVEMFVFPQNMNNTWRSLVANEFPSAANTSWMKAIVDFAHAGGVEVGAYQLLLNARSATAPNQCAPSDAASLPNVGYDCQDPATRLPDHKGGREKCKGGPGCSALCGATAFYDKMEASMHAWWRATVSHPIPPSNPQSTTLPDV